MCGRDNRGDKGRELQHWNAKQALNELLELLPETLSLQSSSICLCCFLLNPRLVWLGGCCVRWRLFLSKAGRLSWACSAFSALCSSFCCFSHCRLVSLFLHHSHSNFLSTSGTSCVLWLLVGLKFTGTCWEALYDLDIFSFFLIYILLSTYRCICTSLP